jgi:hypothetical protein
MNIIAPRSLLLVSLPLLVVGVDPDSTRTAYVVLARPEDDVVFRVAEVDGGGRGKTAVAWGDVRGATTLAVRWRAESGGRVLVGIEAQLASGGAHSSDVEGCRRARWHWDAACLLADVQAQHIDPGAWEPRIHPDGRPLGPGERKAEYRRQALEFDERLNNEDRAAGFGIARYLVEQLGGEVVRTVTT